MKLQRCLITLSLLVTAVGSAQAGNVLFRATTGPSGAAAMADKRTFSASADVTLSGGGGSLALALGYAFTPRWSVHVDATTSFILGPELEWDAGGGQEGTVTYDEDVEWGIHYLGIGGTSYYGSSGFYGTGSGGVVLMTWRAPMEDMDQTELGYGGRLALGKEWSVSPRWGLGLALEGMYGIVPDSGGDWTTVALNLAFSVTHH